MHSLTLAAALAAAGTNAFMVPPNMAMPNTEGLPSGPLDFKIGVVHGPHSRFSNPMATFGVDPYESVVAVPCPGCPMARFDDAGKKNGEGRMISFERGQKNYLYMKITANETGTLQLNGATFYPPERVFSGDVSPPRVPQIPEDVSLEQLKARPEMLSSDHSLKLSGWGLQAASSHDRAHPTSGEEVVKIHLQINSIEHHRVLIPEVLITALKLKDGHLMLLDTAVSERPVGPFGSMHCSDWPMLCKWRAILADRVSAMRHKMHGAGARMGCHGDHGGHGGQHGGMMPAFFGGKHPHAHGHGPDGRPHHRPHFRIGEHNGHRGHHRGHHRSTMDKVARVLLTVVIPILVGVLAGMLTYLVGMVVGSGIALLWMRFRGRRGYQAVALGDEEVVVVKGRGSMEKEGLLFVDEEEVEEGLPEYVEVEANEVKI